MPNRGPDYEAVTHEQLHIGQKVLFEKMDEVIKATHANQLYLTQIDGHVQMMAERGTVQVAKLGEMEGWVRDLQASENSRKGERGVWAALLHSPFAAWVAAIVAAIWAFINHAGVPKQ